MGDKNFWDFSMIAGGSVVSYASLMGEMESFLGLILLFLTLVLTLLRIFIIIKQWRKEQE